MSSVSTYGKRKDHRRILFTSADGSRPTIYLGKISKIGAKTIQGHIDQIVSAQIGQYAIPQHTAEWLADMPATLADKFAKVGLLPEGKRRSTSTLGAFLDDYLDRRIDVKPATKVAWGHVIRGLKEHFGEGRELRSIDEGDAEDFKMYLVAEELAPTTVAKRLQFARAFFRNARKRKLIRENPFAEVAAMARLPEGADHFVTIEETDAIFKACDPTWTVIFGLVRWAGMRCPSEVLSLKWSGINWETGKMLVYSPKTECHGKPSRTVPLFPELRSILWEALQTAPDGAVYVVDPRYRAVCLTKDGWANVNLRTQFRRIIEKAGLTPWKRLWKSVRGTRQTELEARFPIHAVCKWLGNTPKIAHKHYLQTTEADFTRATTEGQTQCADRNTVDAQIATQIVSECIG
jgi:integrase